MPYITREDGERFIIPSYRDVLSAKKQVLLRKEIQLLSTKYGEYITLHRKNVEQYEVTFSPDHGYLLGETVWHHFKRPIDLIYCEAIPNTSEAILVIVKSGSVYLDGSFPVDSIPEELVIFRTQQNNFDIYIYGDVPVSKAPEEGKFSLDSSSVKSFNILPEPVFAKLPLLKQFQLQLVEVVLKAQGIGVFPTKQLIALAVVIALGWMGWTYLTTHKRELPTVFVGVVNPNQTYMDALTSPDPYDQVKLVISQLEKLYTIPGWYPVSLLFNGVKSQAVVLSSGVQAKVLFEWAAQNGASLQIQHDGVYVFFTATTPKRPPPTTITESQEVIAVMLDRLATVIPGNALLVGNTADHGRYSETQLTININDITLTTLDLIAQQLRGLPLVLAAVNIQIAGNGLTGTIVLKALGN